MKITKIHYNWYYNTTEDYGDEYEIAEVGKDNVIEIIARYPQGEGDLFRATIVYKDGSEITVFNPNKIFEIKEKDDDKEPAF